MVLKICLAIMIKNEEKTILKSLNSCKDITSHVRIYDTGSTDDTLSIIETFKIDNPLVDVGVKHGDFVDFAVSRNVLLEFVEETKDIDFCILLDSNDEMKGCEELLTFLQSQKEKNDKGVTGYLVRQKWFTGNSMDTYFNIRLIKGNCGWRYISPVHESITNKITPQTIIVKIETPNIMIYQDRTQDCENTYQRFKRDKVILLREHLKHPTDTRTLFYLAQTYGSLGLQKEAYYYYHLRVELGDYDEERYHSYFRMGEISRNLNSDSTVYINWFMKALELFPIPRVEPLIEIVNYYLFNNVNYNMAGLFSNLALHSSYPQFCNLFINKQHYDYTRYHLDGIIQYYLNNIKQGKTSCSTAIQYNQNLLENTTDQVKKMITYKMKFDSDNLKMYDDLKPKHDNKIKSTGKYTLYDYDMCSTTEFNNVLYTFDDKNRFSLEHDILKQQYESTPNQIQYLFHIAQTLEKLNQLNDAYFYYQLFLSKIQDPVKTAKKSHIEEKKEMLVQFEKDNAKNVVPTNKNDNFTKKITPKQLEFLQEIDTCQRKQIEQIRVELKGKYRDEEFQATFRLAEIAKILNMGSSVFIPLYIKSIEVYSEPRLEPLIRLATYYTFEKQNFKLASMFLDMAITLHYPSKESKFFINRLHYDYTRYHLDGIAQYYLGNFERGMKHCQKAIDFNTSLLSQYQFQNSKYKNIASVKLNTDKANLKCYVDKIKTMKSSLIASN